MLFIVTLHMWPTNQFTVTVMTLCQKMLTPLFYILSNCVVTQGMECQIPKWWDDMRSIIRVDCNLQVKNLAEQ
jgi:hypothetical protein